MKKNHSLPQYTPSAPSIKHHFSNTQFPAEWGRCHLDDLVDKSAPICYGILMPGVHVADGIPVIKVKDYVRGPIRAHELLRTTRAIDRQYHRSRVRDGDLLLSIRGGTGDLAVVPTELDGANITQDTARLRAAPHVDKKYLFWSLRGSFVQSQITLDTIGQAVTGINIGSVRQLVIPTPPLPEQRKIADILSTWDEALETLDALIAAKDRQKQALMQQLLTGKTRVKGAKGATAFVRASELFTNRSERNTHGLPILSVTQDQGVVLRSSLERRIAHDEETNGSYKVVRKGDFVISLRSFQGGLEYSDIEGAVSPAYHIIHARRDLDQLFFKHYFKSADFISRLATAVIGIRDGKQISFTDFGFIKLPFPPVEDQRRIGLLLDTADQEITLLRTQRQTLDQQKRGLMQRLLTGKIRVPVS